MIAQTTAQTQVLLESGARLKIAALDSEIESLLHKSHGNVPLEPGRDVQILPIRELPAKKGLSTREGQARLLHDLASIELQAMELGLRTLIEFPDAPKAFREELAEVTRDEGRHFALCLDGLENMGCPWGSFATHLGLWQAVSQEDELLDRVLIVHRYLEGSGLDASETFLRRLKGVNAPETRKAVEVIGHDELAHVQFGSHWYRELAKGEGLDPDQDFTARLKKLSHTLPRRLEPIEVDIRARAGFSPLEIKALQNLREELMRTGRPQKLSSS